jgi:hypothetical protein
MIFALGLAPRLASAAPPLAGRTFTLDAGFTNRAQQAVARQEPGYIPYNDCADWIGWFLERYYHLPTGWRSTNATQMARNVVQSGIAGVITGDQRPDSGSLVSIDKAAQYFDSNSSAYLDRGLDGSGKNRREYIIAYKWNQDPSSQTYSHLALYVGNGEVVAHGTSADGTFDGEWNTTPQDWDQYLSPSTQAQDWQVAIIALHSGPINPAPYRVAPPDRSWSLTLSADQTDVTPGTPVNLTAEASQAVDNTGYSIDIIDTTDAQVVASCTTGDSCAVQLTTDVDDTITYMAEIGDVVQSDTTQDVTWEDYPALGGDASGDWTVTLSADETDVEVDTAVNLTAQASQDVDSSGYILEIVDEGSDDTVTSCDSGNNCTGQVVMESGDTETYIAEVVDQYGNIVAQSDPLDVAWEEYS